MHEKFTQKYSTVSIEPSYIKSLLEFSQAAPQAVFPHISLKSFFILLSPQFFFIWTLLPYFVEPKDIQDFYRFWIASPYVIFPLWRKFLPLFSYTETPSANCKSSFSRPLCLSLNGIRAWVVLSIKNFFSWSSPCLSTFAPPNSNPQQSTDVAYHPSPFPWSKSRKHMKPVFSSWFPQFQPSPVRVKLS